MIQIVSSGASTYVIALPASPSQTERTAASEVQTHIKEMCGVTLAITSETTSPENALYIGATDFASTNGIAPTGVEAWQVKVVGHQVAIAGSDDRGTLYGAYHFLEDELGVRWWNPWESHIPSKSTIEINESLNLSGSPSFLYRDIYDGIYDKGPFFNGTQPFSPFYVRNRLNGHFSFAPDDHGGTITYGPPYHTHTFDRYISPDDYFDSHPEYFSQIGGTRVPNAQLCLTNTGLKNLMLSKVESEITAAYAAADASGKSRPKIFALTPNDTPGLCEDAPCAAERNAYGNSGYLLRFVNVIATSLQTSFPDVTFETLAYWDYIDAPLGGIAPASNVQIRFADNENLDVLHDIAHPNHDAMRENLESWLSISNNICFWQYGANYYPNPPYAAVTRTKADQAYLNGKGVIGLFVEHEGTATTDMWDMNMWVRAKFLEDIDRDLSATMHDFTAGYYGPAAASINSYLDLTQALLSSTSNRAGFADAYEAYSFYTLSYVNQATTLLNAATEAVSGDPVLTYRVDLVRASVDRLILFRWWELWNESVTTSVPMVFDRKTSARRLLNTLLAALGERARADFNGAAVDEQIRALLVPPALAAIPYSLMSDPNVDDFIIWTANGGAEFYDDPYSQMGRAVRISLANISPDLWRDYHKPPILCGLYNPSDGARVLREIPASQLVLNEYSTYALGTRRLKASDSIYFFRSWGVQVNVAPLVSGKPDQRYDIYANMQFTGAAFGGSGAWPDTASIDRVILVAKGPLPASLSTLDDSKTTDFSPESFRLWTADGGVSRGADSTALTGRSARIALAQIPDKTKREYHLVSTGKPFPIGLYNPDSGERVIREVPFSSIVPDQYAVYTVSDVHPAANDYLYLFRSWWIQCEVHEAFSTDPSQRYDFHISAKFQGAAYGGDPANADAIYVDRILVVRR